jgi:hypothetical protein
MRLEAGVVASGHHLLFFAQMHLDVLGQHGQRFQHPDLVAIAMKVAARSNNCRCCASMFGKPTSIFGDHSTNSNFIFAPIVA